jgi:hypothetical protein
METVEVRRILFRHLLALSLFAGFAGIIWVLNHDGRRLGPRLNLPDYPLHLGRGKAGEILDGSFRLRNVGSAPLHFHLTPSCGCSDLNPRTGIIPPGEVQDVHIGVRLQEEGAERDVFVTIDTNDPTTPNARYMVRAECTAPLLVTPRTVQFSNVPRGNTPRVHVRVRDEEDRPLGSKTDLRVTSDNPYLSIEQGVDGNNDLYLTLTLSGKAPPGWLSGTVRLRLSGQDRDVELPVSANILGAIIASPSTLFLGSDEGHREARVFVWRPDGGLLGKLVKVDAPTGVTIEELSAETERRRRFRVRLAGTTPPSRPIQFQFQEVKEPATIQVVPPLGSGTTVHESREEGSSTTKGRAEL